MKLNVTDTSAIFSGTWSGKTPEQTHTQTGYMNSGSTRGKPQTPTSSSDSK